MRPKGAAPAPPPLPHLKMPAMASKPRVSRPKPRAAAEVAKRPTEGAAARRPPPPAIPDGTVLPPPLPSPPSVQAAQAAQALGEGPTEPLRHAEDIIAALRVLVRDAPLPLAEVPPATVRRLVADAGDGALSTAPEGRDALFRFAHALRPAAVFDVDRRRGQLRLRPGVAAIARRAAALVAQLSPWQPASGSTGYVSLGHLTQLLGPTEKALVRDCGGLHRVLQVFDDAFFLRGAASAKLLKQPPAEAPQDTPCAPTPALSGAESVLTLPDDDGDGEAEPGTVVPVEKAEEPFVATLRRLLPPDGAWVQLAAVQSAMRPLTVPPLAQLPPGIHWRLTPQATLLRADPAPDAPDIAPDLAPAAGWHFLDTEVACDPFAEALAPLLPPAWLPLAVLTTRGAGAVLPPLHASMLGGSGVAVSTSPAVEAARLDGVLQLRRPAAVGAHLPAWAGRALRGLVHALGAVLEESVGDATVTVAHIEAGLSDPVALSLFLETGDLRRAVRSAGGVAPVLRTLGGVSIDGNGGTAVVQLHGSSGGPGLSGPPSPAPDPVACADRAADG